MRGAAARLRLLAASLSLACGACRTPAFPAWAVPHCPGTLRTTEEIPGSFLLRERMRIRLEGRDIPLELVVEKRGDTLVLLGFNPFGAKLFSITQRGVETEVEAVPPPALEVPPENVLADLHRVHFLGLERVELADGRALVRHPDCGYSATLRTLERREL